MGKDTNIGWTDHTFNPWKGCTKVSEGCLHCYAEDWAKRFNQVTWNAPPILTSKAKWREPKKWNKELGENETATVFCASLADIFDQNAPNEWRDRVWDLIEATQKLTYLLLTKRPEAAVEQFPYHLPNAWLGVTIENQKRLEERMPLIHECQAKHKFLSIEPLLEKITLKHHDLSDIDWIIVGGESGSKARPFHLEWGSNLISECQELGIPVFMKQLGSNAYWQGESFKTRSSHGDDISEFPSFLQVQNFPTFRDTEEKFKDRGQQLTLNLD